MKRLTAAIAVLPLPAGRTAVRNTAGSIQRNSRLRQLGYGLSPKDGPILK